MTLLAARHRRWVLVAALLGLGLRVGWVLYASRAPLGLFDPARYAGYADLIADGDGYVQFTSGEATAYYPPGYPFFLGLIEWLARHTPLPDDLPLVAGMAQALLGAATVGLAAIVARRLIGPAAAIATAFVVALYPNLVFHTGALLSETLFNALFIGALAVLVWRPWPDGLPLGQLAGSAVLFAAAVMVRPISLAVLPALAVVWWLDRHDWRVVLRRLAVYVAVVAVFVAPWTVRNLVRMDAFVVLSTNTGDNLCVGHHPGASGGFDLSPDCDTGESTADGAAAEVRHDRELTDRALDFIADDPGAEVGLVWRRAKFMFRDDHDALRAVQSYGEDDFISRDTEDLLATLADGYYYAVLALGLAGMVVLFDRRRPDRLLVVLAAVATVAVPFAFFGDPRFKVPAVPLLAIAAPAAAASLRTLVLERRASGPPEDSA
jgi:hypothetical protein